MRIDRTTTARNKPKPVAAVNSLVRRFASHVDEMSEPHQAPLRPAGRSSAMPDEVKAPAPVERRVAALERAFEERNLIPAGFIDDFAHIAQEDWVPANGARVVARAWTDPEFKRRLLENGKAAVAELGLTMPDHHKHLVVLENTPSLQNVICCTLCSCTAFTIIGLP